MRRRGRPSTPRPAATGYNGRSRRADCDEGLLRPVSQLATASLEAPIIAANSPRVRPMVFRTSRIGWCGFVFLLQTFLVTDHWSLITGH